MTSTKIAAGSAIQDLAKWYQPDDFPDSARAKLFAELVKPAMRVMSRYHSDLYHDALWIRTHVGLQEKQTMTFYFAADEAGTAIGADRDLVFRFRADLQMTVEIIHVKEYHAGDGVWQARYTIH